MRKLNIVFLTPSFIYPIIGGDRLKPFMLIKHLAEKHNVTLISAGTEKFISPDRYKPFLEMNIDVKYHYFNKPYHAVKAVIKTLFRHPLEAEFFNTSSFNGFVKQIVAEKNADLIINYFERTTESVKKLNISKILVLEDCRSLYQKRSFANKKSILQSIKRYWEYKKLSKYESNIPLYFDKTTLVTDIDLEAVRTLCPKASYGILSNGVNSSMFTPLDTERNDIYFVGKLDVWINILMIDIILKLIFPKIQKELPETKLFIVGANPSAKLKNSLPDNAYIIENPVSVVPYLSKAAVFIHPQFSGSGIQNKILEALACGAPIVSTPIGTQGINIENGKNGFVSENMDELIKYSIELLRNPDLQTTISKNAIVTASEKHSWQSVFNKFDEIIADVLND